MEKIEVMQLNADERLTLIKYIINTRHLLTMNETRYMIKHILDNIHFVIKHNSLMIPKRSNHSIGYPIEKLKKLFKKDDKSHKS